MRTFSQREIADLSALLEDPARLSTGESALDLHRRDSSSHRPGHPAAVVWPTSTEEVSLLMAWCSEHEVPVTPWGAGTSTEGNPIPTRGGLVMDFTRMDRILEVRPDDLQVDVQPGVLRKRLNRRLRDDGLFFPPDPGADATIGGMIGNNASGPRTVRYGATKDCVMRLVVVLADGEVIHVGTTAPKTSSGYDLLHLFVGSEGTLGLVTEATLKLAGLPSDVLAATVPFDSLREAVEAVAGLLGTGVAPAALELLTPELLGLLNREAGLGLPEVPTLFCEFHAVSPAALREVADVAEDVCRQCGASDFSAGFDRAARAELWRARHEAWETIRRAHPGKDTLVADVAVPSSRLPETVLFAQELIDRHAVTGYVFGHAGDGNVHVVFVGDPEDEAEWNRLVEINESVVLRALELGGTCTGEHGVGIGKRKFMDREHGTALAVMKRFKDALDPKGLLNPGKIFP